MLPLLCQVNITCLEHKHVVNGDTVVVKALTGLLNSNPDITGIRPYKTQVDTGGQRGKLTEKENSIKAANYRLLMINSDSIRIPNAGASISS